MRLPAIPTIGDGPCLANGCSACCHDTEMLLSEADILRISVHETEPFWHEDDGYLVLRTRDGPPVAGHRGRPCWFLTDNGRCRIHDWRPEGCRLYPAILDADRGRARLDDEHCPHTDGFRLPRATDDAVRRLVDRLERERDSRSQQG